MRAEDKNRVESAKVSIQRFHHGPLGKVLQRFLHERGDRDDFDLVALEQLWHRAAEHDPAIGLHLFSLFTPQDWHVLACLGFYAANPQQSLDCWVRYQSLASSMDSIRSVKIDGMTGVSIRVHAAAGLERYLVEHYMNMALTQMRAAAQTALTPARVCLRHRKPDYHEAYRPVLGECVEFAAAENQLWFSDADMQCAHPGANRAMFELVCCELDRRLAQQQQFGGTAGQVAALVRRGLLDGVQVSLEEVAPALHLSTRTLRRRLQGQGLNFRQLLDLVRAELDQYLALQGLTRAQIADRLGYGDTAAYLHARKRWQPQVSSLAADTSA